jgi:SAM-dependent methyltransferase
MHSKNTILNKSWHSCWETSVYKKGKQLNKYPHHEVVAFLFKNFPENDLRKIKILELGFGAGNNLWFAARENYRVAGIEGSKTAFEYAKERFKKNGIDGDLRLGDFNSLPWENDTFDAVIDRGSLACNCKKNIEETLNETKRVMKKNGKIFSFFYSDKHPGRLFGKDIGDNTFSDFKGGYFKGLGRIHFANIKEIEELFGSRFRILNLIHTFEENYLSEKPTPKNSFWKIECMKT